MQLHLMSLRETWKLELEDIFDPLRNFPSSADYEYC